MVELEPMKEKWQGIWLGQDGFKGMLRGGEFSITRGQAEVRRTIICQGCWRALVLQLFHKHQNHPKSLEIAGTHPWVSDSESLGWGLKLCISNPCPGHVMLLVQDHTLRTTVVVRMRHFTPAKVYKARSHFYSMSYQTAWVQCCHMKLGFFPAWGYLWW